MSNKTVSVCICTYKRPEMLLRLLESVGAQEHLDGYDVKIIVVDNDAGQSAKVVVDKVIESFPFPVQYACEERPGISCARNTALAVAGESDFYITIDDDEYASLNWISELLKTQVEYEADAVAGPVVPYFDADCPEWAKPLWNRGKMATGTRLPVFRTGNLLLKSDILKPDGELFDTKFNLSGGSDTMLSLTLARDGKKFVWCDTAPVYERQSVEKCTFGYYLLRGYIGGRNFRYCYRLCYPDVLTFIKGIIKDTGWVVCGGLIAISAIFRGKTWLVKGLATAAKGIGGLRSVFSSDLRLYRREKNVPES